MAPSSYSYKYTKGTDSSSVLLREFKTTFPGQQVDKAFKALLDVLINVQGAYLDVDDLLLLHFFRRRHETHWNEVREAYPYDDRRLKERLASLETNLHMLEHSSCQPLHHLQTVAACERSLRPTAKSTYQAMEPGLSGIYG